MQLPLESTEFLQPLLWRCLSCWTSRCHWKAAISITDMRTHLWHHWCHLLGHVHILRLGIDGRGRHCLVRWEVSHLLTHLSNLPHLADLTNLTHLTGWHQNADDDLLRE